MAEITFKGPYHSSMIIKNDSEFNYAGVYIWGFMVDKDYIPINCKNKHEYKKGEMSFLPYYVGMATGKSDMFVKNRLLSHKNISISPAAKYTRINKKYFKIFISDSDFPIHFKYDKYYPKNILKFNIKHNEKAIYYFNNALFMFTLYKSQLIHKVDTLFNTLKSNDLPITSEIFSDFLKNDPLVEIVNKKDNFWFMCFDASELKENQKKNTAFFENLEGLIFYYLKGKTIGQTEKFEDLNNIGFKIKEIETNIFKESPSEVFPGYL